MFVYEVESIKNWRAYFGHESVEHGQFGRNFTVDGQSGNSR